MRFVGVSRTLLATLFACILATLPSPASAHGGVVEEDDLCVINIGYLRAHFKIYVPEQSGHRDYCEDIPVRGTSLFESPSLSRRLLRELFQNLVDAQFINNLLGQVLPIEDL